MAIEIACFTDIDAVAADANGALDRERQPRLFDRLDWYRLVLTHCPPPGAPLIVRARDGDAATWLFLMRNGQHAVALANWYTLETGLIQEGPRAPALWAAIAWHLRQAEKLAVIDLYPLSESRMHDLATAFRNAHWRALPIKTSVNWNLTLPGPDWDQFLHDRPTRLRNTIRRKGRASNLSIEIIDKFYDDRWYIYEYIYERSWKPEEGCPAMLRELARQEAAAGTLRLGLAFDDGAPVAAQFWLIENGKATIHKLAHVESVKSRSPGTLLTAAMFRHAIEQDRVSRIDFGTGDDPYKADWMDQAHALYRLRLYNLQKLAGLGLWARDRLSAMRRAIRRAR